MLEKLADLGPMLKYMLADFWRGDGRKIFGSAYTLPLGWLILFFRPGNPVPSVIPALWQGPLVSTSLSIWLDPRHLQGRRSRVACPP